tara:strand:+ start:3621 stop:4880 length:1260 start_codon:yes stop_codon:yes gene_type:complete
MPVAQRNTDTDPENSDRNAADAEIANRPNVTHEDEPERAEAAPKPRADADADDGDGEINEPPPFAEDPRLAMGERYTKKRRDKLAEEEGKPAVAITPGNVDRVAPNDDEGTRDEAAPQSRAPAADDPIIEMIVDGKKITLPLSEMKAITQKNLAADSRLEQANQLLREAKNFARNPAPAENQSEAPANRAQSGTDKGASNQMTPEHRLELIEAIQTGSPEEADAALSELQAANPSLSPERVSGMVAEAVQRQEVQAATNRAIESLRTEFPEVSKDVELQTFVVRRTAETMLNALRDAGIPEDHFEQLQGNHNWIGDYYKEAFAHPDYRSKLKPALELAKGAARQVHDKYVAPFKGSGTNSNLQQSGRAGQIEVSPERAARKTGLSRQPRSASMRANPGAAPDTSIQDKRRAAFQELRQR